jgi:glutathione peroxidase
MPKMTIYDFHAKTIDGSDVALGDYRGEVLLIVNVASKCMFTPHYEGLEKLYENFHGRGFSVLGFPCNQFGEQEPGSEGEIKNFCSTTYNVTFPLFSKIEVNGPAAHPLWEFLKNEKPGAFGTKRIKWNFTKFLIDRTGQPVKRYAPRSKPEKITKDIERLLAESGGQRG